MTDDADADDNDDCSCGEDGDVHRACEMTRAKQAAWLGLEWKAGKALRNEEGTWRECAEQTAT